MICHGVLNFKQYLFISYQIILKQWAYINQGSSYIATSPIAQGYRKLCWAIIIFAFVARLTTGKVIMVSEISRILSFNTSVILWYSSKVKYNSEKVAYKLIIVFGKDCSNFIKATTTIS